jgi:alkylation response protein AidB-like acyl-CoA dehydrogenase
VKGSFSGKNPLCAEFREWGLEKVRPSVLEREQRRQFDHAMWQALGGTGLFRLAVSPVWGGEGQSASDFLSALYGLSMGSLDLPFLLSAVAHSVALQMLATYGNEHQCARYLTEMIQGRRLSAVCNNEEVSGTDVRSMTSKCVVEGLSGLLNVRKPLASNVSAADLLFVSAWTLDGDKKPVINIFMVEAGGSRVVQSPHTALSGFLTGATGGLVIDNLPIDVAKSRVGDGPSGMQVLKYCFALERLMIPTIIAGTLHAMLELAMEHVTGRQSFGKPVSDNQYVQEKILQIHQTKETIVSFISRLMTDPDVTRINGFPVDDKLLSPLKTLAVEEGFRAAEHFYEIFGGRGYFSSHHSQKILRDIMAFKALGGTKEQQKIVTFNELLKEYQRSKGERNEQKSTLVAC